MGIDIERNEEEENCKQKKRVDVKGKRRRLLREKGERKKKIFRGKQSSRGMEGRC